MNKQKTVHDVLTAEEAKLIEGLRRHPDMMERVQPTHDRPPTSTTFRSKSA